VNRFETPILFLVFNRPATTAKVLKKIKEIQPKFLFIAADGPRKNQPADIQKCKEVRHIIDSSIDWDCKVERLYREENLGCGLGVSGAITWFFQNVESGIIVEDDTVPDRSFFHYCEKLLDRYKEDTSVMHITGNNFADAKDDDPDYFFTRLPFVWGWATWKRAWNKYDYTYKNIPLIEKKTIIEKAFRNKQISNFWTKTLSDFHLKPISYTWDYQWFLSIWNNNGYVIQPKKNLVQNIGFNSEATHTVATDHHLSEVKAEELSNIEFVNSIKINTRKELENFQSYFMNKKGAVKNNSYLPKTRGFAGLLRMVAAKVSIKLFPELALLKNPNNGWNLIRSYQFKSEVSNLSKLYPPFHVDNSRIGDYTYVAHNSTIYYTAVGKFCSIGPNVFCGWGSHPVNGLSTAPMFYSSFKQNGITLSEVNKVEEAKPVKIGNDVFIGANVTILNGITIGDGAVIGAGAVVSKDIPDYAIAVGSPIKIIKYRFDEKQIEKLLKIRWWDFKHEDLSEIEKHFFDVDTFINKYFKG